MGSGTPFRKHSTEEGPEIESLYWPMAHRYDEPAPAHQPLSFWLEVVNHPRFCNVSVSKGSTRNNGSIWLTVPGLPEHELLPWNPYLEAWMVMRHQRHCLSTAHVHALIEQERRRQAQKETNHGMASAVAVSPRRPRP